MIKLREPIISKDETFQEIEHNNIVIGSIYTYYKQGDKITLYQTLVPNLEFYKKKYSHYGEEEGFMFIFFNTMNELLRFKRIEYAN